MSPTVSVIVPAYNIAPFIAETIDSVLAQTFQDFEIVVVNDASDDTPALIEALRPYRDRITYLEQPRGGAAKARNTAIAASGGEWLAFLDGDDLWVPEFLQVQLDRLRAAPDAVLIWADSQPFGGAPNAPTLMQSEPPSGECDATALLVGRCVVFTSTTVASRQVVVEVGSFDESLFRGEDFDLWLRVARRGRLLYNRDVLGRRRLHPNSLSASAPPMLRAQIDVRRRFVAGLPPDDPLHRLAAEADRRCEAALALAEGHRLLAGGEAAAARAELIKAARVQPSWKLSAMLRLLAIAPSLAVALHRWRRGAVATPTG
jgi:glycosyltransferase involved in cell wall biosynthesis